MGTCRLNFQGDERDGLHRCPVTNRAAPIMQQADTDSLVPRYRADVRAQLKGLGRNPGLLSQIPPTVASLRAEKNRPSQVRLRTVHHPNSNSHTVPHCLNQHSIHRHRASPKSHCQSQQRHWLITQLRPFGMHASRTLEPSFCVGYAQPCRFSNGNCI